MVQTVSRSPPTTGIPSSHIDQSMWISWRPTRSLGWFFLGFSLPQILYHHFFLIKTCGEFRWSPEGQDSQIHLHAGAPGIFPELLRSIQMLKREWGVESNGSYRTYPSLVKLQGSWVCGGKSAFVQNCSLGSWVCNKGPDFWQNTLMMISSLIFFFLSLSLSLSLSLLLPSIS